MAFPDCAPREFSNTADHGAHEGLGRAAEIGQVGPARRRLADGIQLSVSTMGKDAAARGRPQQLVAYGAAYGDDEFQPCDIAASASWENP